MKAIVYYEYGSPDVLELKDIDKPVVPEVPGGAIVAHGSRERPYPWKR